MEDSAYVEKLRSLQQYVPFLHRMIHKLETLSDSGREAQLQKIKQLLKILTDSKPRLKGNLLAKCESILVKLYAKAEGEWDKGREYNSQTGSFSGSVISRSSEDVALTTGRMDDVISVNVDDESPVEIIHSPPLSSYVENLCMSSPTSADYTQQPRSPSPECVQVVTHREYQNVRCSDSRLVQSMSSNEANAMHNDGKWRSSEVDPPVIPLIRRSNWHSGSLIVESKAYDEVRKVSFKDDTHDSRGYLKRPTHTSRDVRMEPQAEHVHNPETKCSRNSLDFGSQNWKSFCSSRTVTISPSNHRRSVFNQSQETVKNSNYNSNRASAKSDMMSMGNASKHTEEEHIHPGKQHENMQKKFPVAPVHSKTSDADSDVNDVRSSKHQKACSAANYQQCHSVQTANTAAGVDQIDAIKGSLRRSLLIRDLLLYTKKPDIVQLFKGFRVKEVIIERDTKNSTGMAYVEFSSQSEAEEAFKFCNNVYLFGKKVSMSFCGECASTDSGTINNDFNSVNAGSAAKHVLPMKQPPVVRPPSFRSCHNHATNFPRAPSNLTLRGASLSLNPGQRMPNFQKAYKTGTEPCKSLHHGKFASNPGTNVECHIPPSDKQGTKSSITPAFHSPPTVERVPEPVYHGPNPKLDKQGDNVDGENKSEPLDRVDVRTPNVHDPRIRAKLAYEKDKHKRRLDVLEKLRSQKTEIENKLKGYEETSSSSKSSGEIPIPSASLSSFKIPKLKSKPCQTGKMCAENKHIKFHTSESAQDNVEVDKNQQSNVNTCSPTAEDSHSDVHQEDEVSSTVHEPSLSKDMCEQDKRECSTAVNLEKESLPSSSQIQSSELSESATPSNVITSSEKSPSVNNHSRADMDNSQLSEAISEIVEKDGISYVGVGGVSTEDKAAAVSGGPDVSENLLDSNRLRRKQRMRKRRKERKRRLNEEREKRKNETLTQSILSDSTISDITISNKVESTAVQFESDVNDSVTNEKYTCHLPSEADRAEDKVYDNVISTKTPTGSLNESGDDSKNVPTTETSSTVVDVHNSIISSQVVDSSSDDINISSRRPSKGGICRELKQLAQCSGFETSNEGSEESTTIKNGRKLRKRSRGPGFYFSGFNDSTNILNDENDVLLDVTDFTSNDLMSGGTVIANSEVCKEQEKSSRNSETSKVIEVRDVSSCSSNEISQSQIEGNECVKSPEVPPAVNEPNVEDKRENEERSSDYCQACKEQLSKGNLHVCHVVSTKFPLKLKADFVQHASETDYAFERCQLDPSPDHLRQAVMCDDLLWIPFNTVFSKPLCCKYCSYKSFFRPHMLSHVASHLMFSHSCVNHFKCRFCDKTSSDLQLLRDHISEHTGEHRYSCALCNWHVSQLDLARKHKCRDTEIGLIKVSELEEDFSWNAVFVYACPFCGFARMTKQKVQDHFTSEHPSELLDKTGGIVKIVATSLVEGDIEACEDQVDAEVVDTYVQLMNIDERLPHWIQPNSDASESDVSPVVEYDDIGDSPYVGVSQVLELWSGMNICWPELAFKVSEQYMRALHSEEHTMLSQMENTMNACRDKINVEYNRFDACFSIVELVAGLEYSCVQFLASVKQEYASAIPVVFDASVSDSVDTQESLPQTLDDVNPERQGDDTDQDSCSVNSDDSVQWLVDSELSDDSMCLPRSEPGVVVYDIGKMSDGSTESQLVNKLLRRIANSMPSRSQRPWDRSSNSNLRELGSLLEEFEAFERGDIVRNELSSSTQQGVENLKISSVVSLSDAESQNKESLADCSKCSPADDSGDGVCTFPAHGPLRPWRHFLSLKEPAKIVRLMHHVHHRSVYKCGAAHCNFTTNNGALFRLHLGVHDTCSACDQTSAGVECRRLCRACVYCGYTADRGDGCVDLAEHVYGEHAAAALQCGYCFYRCTQPAYMNDHQRRWHADLPPYYLLSDRAKPPPGVDENATSCVPTLPESSLAPYQCAVGDCDAKFVRADKFLQHHVDLHPPIFGEFVCHICRVSCTTFKQLIQHYMSHGLSNYTCAYCGFSCQQQQAMKHHLVDFHAGVAPKCFSRMTKKFLYEVLGESAEMLNKTEMPSKTGNTDECVAGVKQEPNNSENVQDVLPHEQPDISDQQCSDNVGQDGRCSTPERRTLVGVSFTSVDAEMTDAIPDDQRSGTAAEPTTDTSEAECKHAPTATATATAATVEVDNVDMNRAALDEDASRHDTTLDDNVDDDDDNDVDRPSVDVLYRCGNVGCTAVLPSGIEFRRHTVQCYSSGGGAGTTSATAVYNCYHCGRRVHSPTTLLEHVRAHGPRLYRCGVCGIRLSTVHAAHRHLRHKHHLQRPAQTAPIDRRRMQPFRDRFVVYPRCCHGLAGDQQPAADGVVSLSTFMPADLAQLPRRAVLFEPIGCGECAYRTRVTRNMYKHLLKHSSASLPSAADVTNVTAEPGGVDGDGVIVDPTNPRPMASRGTRMSDSTVNLASGSAEVKAVKPETPPPPPPSPPVPAITDEERQQLPRLVAEDRKYVCSIDGCHYLTLNMTMLRHHIQVMHGQMITYPCPHCEPPGSTMLLPDSLAGHLRLHGPQLYKCSHCLFNHYQRFVVKRHCAHRHAGVLSCQVLVVREPSAADTASNTDGKQAGHKETAAPIKEFSCCLCRVRGVSDEALKKHASDVHGMREQFRCALCDFGCGECSEMRRHCASMHVDGPPDAFISAFHRLEQITPSKSTAGSVAGRGNESLCTPLWRRNDPNRVRHVRGVLVEEVSSPVKRPSTGAAVMAPTKRAFVCLSPADAAAVTAANAKRKTAKHLVKKSCASTSSTSSVCGALSPRKTRLSRLLQARGGKDKDVERPQDDKPEDDEDEEPAAATQRGRSIESVDAGAEAAGDTARVTMADVINGRGWLGEADVQMRLFVCPVCATFKTDDTSVLRQHVYREIGDVSYKCDHCDHQSSSLAYVKIHHSLKHKKASLKFAVLPKDDKVKTWVDDLIERQTEQLAGASARVSSEPTDTPDPHKIKPAQQDATQSDVTDTDESTAAVSSSSQQISAADWEVIATAANDLPPDAVLCPRCGLPFAGRREMVEHLQVHYRRYKCGQCSFADSTRINVVRHMAVHHPHEPRTVDYLRPVAEQYERAKASCFKVRTSAARQALLHHEVDPAPATSDTTVQQQQEADKTAAAAAAASGQAVRKKCAVSKKSTAKQRQQSWRPPRNVAVKSTASKHRPLPPDDQGFSYYGTRAPPASHFANVTSRLTLANGISTKVNVPTLSQIIQLYPRVVVKDIKKGGVLSLL